MTALHPEKKMTHFKKYWGAFLQGEVLSLLETKVIFYFIFYFIQVFTCSCTKSGAVRRTLQVLAIKFIRFAANTNFSTTQTVPNGRINSTQP